MNSELKPLEILKGKQILNIETEISTFAAISSNDREMQFEIPIKLFFEQHDLFIYNQWRIESASPIGIDKLIGSVVVSIVLENNILTLGLDNGVQIRVNLSDEAYTGPEAMVLYGPGKSIVVWN